MPGKVIAAHAEFEQECDKCHEVGDRSAQPALCGDCHEEVLADVASRQGFHGRLADTECQLCHFEHHGRNAILAPLNAEDFNHAQTDFLLQGKHTDVTCRDCHEVARKFSETPRECVICHKDDDIHRQALGANCADCHDVSGWPGATLDHLEITGFELLFSHGDVSCTACHDQHRYEATPTSCYGCHKVTDDENGHQAQYGSRCESCHEASAWKNILFDHDRDTKFALDGLHIPVSCSSCHPGKLFEDRRPTECSGCHQQDDPHVGHLGEACANCHSTKAWLSVHFQHDRDSSFKLEGQHQDVECAACHADMTFQLQPLMECIGCHRIDDVEQGHQGRFGDICDGCHKPTRWSESFFDHTDTRFNLLGEHRRVACESCHQVETPGTAPRECVACHAADDKHQQRLGLRCGQCHVADDWLQIYFDHDQQTGYNLEGTHEKIDCLACHQEPMAGKVDLPTTCYACHDDEDVHFGTLGDRCGACHESTDWREVVPNARTWLKLGGPPASEGNPG